MIWLISPKYRHAPKKIDAGIRPRNQNTTEITVRNVYAKQTPRERNRSSLHPFLRCYAIPNEPHFDPEMSQFNPNFSIFWWIMWIIPHLLTKYGEIRTNVGPFLGQDAAPYNEVRFGTFLRKCVNYPTRQQPARMIQLSHPSATCNNDPQACWWQCIWGSYRSRRNIRQKYIDPGAVMPKENAPFEPKSLRAKVRRSCGSSLSHKLPVNDH